MSPASGQRTRLIEAMTQVASRQGYARASVARVVAQAGVSRATFYEHFADRDACFMAAFEAVAAELEPGLERLEAAEDPPRAATAALDELLAAIARNPAAARLILVEALGGGPEARRASYRLLRRIETGLERGLLGGDRDQVPMLSGEALVAGLYGVLMVRSFRNEIGELGTLRDDLVGWVLAYAVAPERQRVRPGSWRQLGSGLRPDPYLKFGAAALERKLPRGKGAVASEHVAAEHRKRIIAGVASLARSKGYAAMSVADIVKAGGVTRETFYELFRSKEDAFMAAQTAGLEESVALSAGSFFSDASWPSRVWNGLRAFLSYIASQPDLVYVDIIECFAAGPAAIHRAVDNRMAFTLFLEEGYRQPNAAADLPRVCSEAIAGAIFGLLYRQVGGGAPEQALELLPEATYLALAPFVGPEYALQLVEEQTAELRRAADAAA